MTAEVILGEFAEAFGIIEVYLFGIGIIEPIDDAAAEILVAVVNVYIAAFACLVSGKQKGIVGILCAVLGFLTASGDAEKHTERKHESKNSINLFHNFSLLYGCSQNENRLWPKLRALFPRLSFLFNYITDEKAFRLMLKTIINHGGANSKT